MKVLITGGAGFIGSNLVSYFNARSPGTEVVVIDDLSTGTPTNLASADTQLVVGSVLDTDLLRRAAHGVDSIVHLGALGSVPRSIVDPNATHAANATGTLAVLDMARRLSIEHVLVASSSSVYGSNLRLPKSEDDWTRPLSPYAVSKLATEAYAVAYANSYGMKTLPLRFFNVYGPRQSIGHAYAAVIPQFIEKVRAGDPLEVHGDGTQSRDFTYVETVCAVLYEAVVRKVSWMSPVNLAFGTNTRLNELIEELARVVGKPLVVRKVSSRVGDVRASQADGLLVRQLFPEVEPVPLREGLAQTWAWFNGQRIAGATGSSSDI